MPPKTCKLCNLLLLLLELQSQNHNLKCSTISTWHLLLLVDYFDPFINLIQTTVFHKSLLEDVEEINDRVIIVRNVHKKFIFIQQIGSLC